jgi:ADP-ribose pyrophosphatase
MQRNIPLHAERVFSGVRTNIYQWDQEMFDGSFSRFEMVEYLKWAFCIPILPDGKILLTRQEQPWVSEYISLPGWSFDFPDEDPQVCALRELCEETWYSSNIIESWFAFHGTKNVITSVYYFIMRDC